METNRGQVFSGRLGDGSGDVLLLLVGERRRVERQHLLLFSLELARVLGESQHEFARICALLELGEAGGALKRQLCEVAVRFLTHLVHLTLQLVEVR